MARYDYSCLECNKVQEIVRDMNDRSPVLCQSCNTQMKRIYSVPNIGTNGSLAEKQKLKDLYKAETEIRHDLKENHLIEKVKPSPGKNLYDVYKGVKESGGMVKEAMLRTIERNSKKVAEKGKIWRKEALKRTPQRAKEKKERRMEEQRLKRRIVV